MEATASDTVSSMTALLCGTATEPPRRAALHPDTSAVCDVLDAPPGTREVPVLSSLCELARRASGLPVHARDTQALMLACLHTNAPGAWYALHSDMKTGHLAWDVAREVLARPGVPQLLATALVTPRDAAHMLYASESCAALLLGAAQETRQAVGAALAGNAKALVDMLSRHGAYMRREAKDAVLSTFGRVLANCELRPADVADVIVQVLDKKDHDLPLLFIHAPLADCLQSCPDLVARVVRRTKSAPPGSRYALLGLLARAATSATGALEGFEVDVLEIATSTLMACTAKMDARVALVASLLVQAVGHHAGALGIALAKALERVAAAHVSSAKPN